MNLQVPRRGLGNVCVVGRQKSCLPREAGLGDLNPAQREAVVHPSGPLLVVAGRQDSIFPIEATERAYARLRRVYELLGCPEKLEKHVLSVKTTTRPLPCNSAAAWTNCPNSDDTLNRRLGKKSRVE